jgi:putative glutamine amidotransferase
MIANLAPPRSKKELNLYINWLNLHEIKFKIISENDTVDGPLILTGGADIGKDIDRDKAESRYLNSAISNNLPVLGICRGMQLTNLLFSGTVEDVKIEENHCVGDFVTENLVTDKPSMYHHCFLDAVRSMKILVNSRHHQHCSKLGNGLKPLFWAEDGTIEAAYHEDKPILLVQWHPERIEDSTQFASEFPLIWLKKYLVESTYPD